MVSKCYKAIPPLAIILIASALFAQPSPEAAASSAAIDAFHAAIRTGDSAAALRLIAADALLIEGGAMQNRAEYAANHLAEDIDFEKAIQSKYRTVRVTVLGDAAWVVSESDSKGTFENKPVDFVGMELAVLTREPSGWRIRSIHWSTRRRTQ